MNVATSMVSQKNLGLGETPKELGNSRVEEPEPQTDLESGMHEPDTGGHSSWKTNPRLPMGVSMDLTILEDPSNPIDYQFGILNCLFKGLQGWWGDVLE